MYDSLFGSSTASTPSRSTDTTSQASRELRRHRRGDAEDPVPPQARAGRPVCHPTRQVGDHDGEFLRRLSGGRNTVLATTGTTAGPLSRTDPSRGIRPASPAVSTFRRSRTGTLPRRDRSGSAVRGARRGRSEESAETGAAAGTNDRTRRPANTSRPTTRLPSRSAHGTAWRRPLRTCPVCRPGTDTASMLRRRPAQARRSAEAAGSRSLIESSRCGRRRRRRTRDDGSDPHGRDGLVPSQRTGTRPPVLLGDAQRGRRRACRADVTSRERTPHRSRSRVGWTACSRRPRWPGSTGSPCPAGRSGTGVRSGSWCCRS
ncbi:hypothetical protein UA75_11945 [Actinoalloteichus sp. GBA129-24]|uniref:Uncharacterized protein n=1 Tax=Actinoalloteichus fjordicus TaxID=1612552 RepID=A0AAC9LD01_9PSEU|nr:hypothetical protein UA74_11860 [Actinoalloteichus fjordicus]APU20401.1 hypothetical protein UA75_11945 [Actinoalloteichus sp. GBA129-24]